MLYYFLDWQWLAIPWVPVALLGTATAFISGFRNTENYNRTLEARKVYEAVSSSSRAFGMMVMDFIRTNNKKEEAALQKELIYRHLAWLTTLRFQLREIKPWENVITRSYNREYLKYYKVPEWENNLEEELKAFLSEEEKIYILSTKNKAAQVLARQSRQLRKLNEQGIVSDDNYIELENQIRDLINYQGCCERIKNFPYPRQFTSINLYFTNLLCFFIPWGFIGAFSQLMDTYGTYIIWLTIPVSMLIGWVFLVLEQVGESAENPFEGSANDVPITQISRKIEIDLRERLGEEDLPPEIQPENNIIL